MTLLHLARFIAMASALLLLAGCIPLKQDKVVGGRPYDSFGYYEDMRCGLLQIGPSNRKRTATVIPNQSYAKAPDGARYGIATDPHPFDLTQGNPYVREQIYLLDKNGQRVTRKWENGRWLFHFALRTPHGTDSRDFQADLSTFYYNPIIHGAPN